MSLIDLAKNDSAATSAYSIEQIEVVPLCWTVWQRG